MFPVKLALAMICAWFIGQCLGHLLWFWWQSRMEKKRHQAWMRLHFSPEMERARKDMIRKAADLHADYSAVLRKLK